MTHKPIRYSKHAAKQASVRHISRDSVRWMLAQGIREHADTRAGEKRWRVSGKVGKRDLYVIFIERASEIEIVTVAEQQKGADDT
ncbi:MAG: DUF4258 domain-containing protein [Gemmatimonadaceae bacterium]